MKNSYIKIILILSTLLFISCSNETKTETISSSIEKDKYGIPWVKDIPTAFSLAKKENKNVLIMAVSKGCSWCRKMKERTLSNPKVAKRLEKYILVQADRETPSQRKQVPEFKHVPVIFFMTPKKELIDDMRGYYLAEDFLAYLDEIEDI